MSTEKLPPASVQALLDAALEARGRAYAPYSGFAVGAAVMAESGEIFTGCNIENASYGATICAERAAISQAVTAGHKSLLAIAVVADHPEPIPPCGICRQVIGEFGPTATVVMANLGGQIRSATLDELLPYAFVFKKEAGG